MVGPFRAAIAAVLLCLATFAPASAAQIIARAGPATTTEIPGVAMSPMPPAIPSPLVIQPGIYSYNGVGYDMTAPGLYYLLAVGSGYFDGGHRIVWNGDIPSFMAAAGRLIRYGRSDEGLSKSSLTHAMRTRTVALRCGPVSDWLVAQAHALGFQARIVRMLTMETPNNYDDGHVAVEARVDGQWVLFDVPSDMAFTVGSTGQPASLRDVADHGYDGLVPVPLAPAESATTAWSGSAFATEVFWNLRLRDDLAGWMRRIYQAIGIDHPNGEVWWLLPPGQEHRTAWVLGLQSNYRVKTRAEFEAAFYP